ncbi:MAG: LPD7 domain-containing protein, partial [Steroidobacteraceae bacterium]
MSSNDRDVSRAAAAAASKGNGHSNGVRATRRRPRPDPERGSRSPPENAIRESPRSQRDPKRLNGSKKHIATAPEQETPKSSDARSKSASAVPPEIEKRFVRVGREFYFPDGARAFTDRGRRLTTPSENTEVIKSLIGIARSRGWQEVVLTGTERFRKEAWLAAQTAGVTARGYRATEFER